MTKPLSQLLSEAQSVVQAIRDAFPSLSEQDALKMIASEPGFTPVPTFVREPTPRSGRTRKTSRRKNSTKRGKTTVDGITQFDVIWAHMGPGQEWGLQDLIQSLTKAGWEDVYSSCTAAGICGNLTTHPELFVRTSPARYVRIDRPGMATRAHDIVEKFQAAKKAKAAPPTRTLPAHRQRQVDNREFYQAVKSVLVDKKPRTLTELVKDVALVADMPWANPHAVVHSLVNQPESGVQRLHDGTYVLKESTPGPDTSSESKPKPEPEAKPNPARVVKTPLGSGSPDYGDTRTQGYIHVLEAILKGKTLRLNDIVRAFNFRVKDCHWGSPRDGLYRILNHPKLGFERTAIGMYRIKPTGTEPEPVQVRALTSLGLIPTSLSRQP